MICRCTDGSRIWPIVTNLQDVKKDVILVCGILPPVDMMGVVSEAMFLGGESLPETTILGPLREIPTSALDQARAQVMQITKRMA
jgi:predicted RNA-binding protein with EMAP domain